MERRLQVSIPSEMLKARRCHIDEAIKAGYALQAGLITGGEFRSIVDLAVDWCKLISQFYRMKIYGPSNP